VVLARDSVPAGTVLVIPDLWLLYYTITTTEKSITAVQIPDEFTVRVCYVTLALTALAHTHKSFYPRCFKMT